jgi:hypothetical protein
MDNPDIAIALAEAFRAFNRLLGLLEVAVQTKPPRMPESSPGVQVISHRRSA